MEVNDDVSPTKETFLPFIAFECKFSTPELKEYWVPVHLSSMQNCQDTPSLNRTELNWKRTHKDTSTAKILQIPASTLVQSKNPYMISGPTTCLPGHSLAGSGLRFPAPHLRSSPSLFASFYNQPTSDETSIEPLPSLSATQTVDKRSPV
ncbi:hypothetical protein M8C21_031994 [Ambrosia artemisiifolia]|uniref:Uncharacterized protein n=1 Tax=Ambrosia artemisiifolia TaxID=4212 RepID=A0AAD5D655_AMBAR|nr:hypothetical protein M8C21_031994 [Ambrosia artemisiifolia]